MPAAHKNANVLGEPTAMARKSDRDDPLSAVRRSLRELRSSARGEIEIALFRLPAREREVVRRYDLAVEPALVVQRALGLSPRQFFRDRRHALTLLDAHLFPCEHDPYERRAANGSARAVAFGGDVEMAARGFARALAQSGNARCLEVLRQLARNAADSVKRLDLLLELAETAIQYSDEAAARDAVETASQLAGTCAFGTAVGDWLFGRLAGVEAHLAATPHEGVAHFSRAVALLRRSVAADPKPFEAWAALADALGDHAILQFWIGGFAAARAASLKAVELIGTLGLSKRPQALETLAMHASFEAVFSGRTRAAVAQVSTLLHHATEAGWSSTASLLGAVVVGLNAVSGDYAEAIRWYRSIAPLAMSAARPADRSGLAREAAHSYTMLGLPQIALSILGYVRPGEGYPRTEVPSWHAYAAAALERRGENAAALRESREALAGYTLQGSERGIGDAHRLIASSQARLGNARAAHEHVREARRLTERYGTPYGLLRTLSTQAAIVQTAALQRDATEYARLLQNLARS
jgi:tetratricopeptide (TPR) repeat protein